LEGNDIGDTGAAKIAEALMSNTTLTGHCEADKTMYATPFMNMCQQQQTATDSSRQQQSSS